MAKSDSIYHYTDIGAISSMLKERKLWATNLGFLNDSQEFHDGLTIMTKLVNGLVVDEGPAFEERGGWKAFLQGALDSYKVFDATEAIYTCSFSQSENLLSQWVSYGGFAVEFSKAVLQQDYTLHQCIYEPDAKKNFANCFLSSYSVRCDEYLAQGKGFFDNGLISLVEVMSSFKHESFFAERELRIIEHDDGGMDGVRFRSKGDFLGSV